MRSQFIPYVSPSYKSRAAALPVGVDARDLKSHDEGKKRKEYYVSEPFPGRPSPGRAGPFGAGTRI